MRNDDLIKFVMLATINALITLAVWQAVQDQATIIAYLAGMVWGSLIICAVWWLKRWDQ